MTMTPHDLIRRYAHGTKKQFGQHFLSDPSILHNIAQHAQVQEGDHVLEIGPGCGTLTWVMLERGAHVTAVEIDRQAAAFLREAMAPYGDRFTLIEADALRVDMGAILRGPVAKWKVAANLPYNVGTEVFFRLAEYADRLDHMTLMFQREVARRMVARVGDETYGALSLMVQLGFDARVVMTLPPGAFMPPPKVHSALLHARPVPGTRIPDEALRRRFVRIVKVAFQARRKQLVNSLRGLGLDKDFVQTSLRWSGLPDQARPENLSFDDFLALANLLDELPGT